MSDWKFGTVVRGDTALPGVHVMLLAKDPDTRSDRRYWNAIVLWDPDPDPMTAWAVGRIVTLHEQGAGVVVVEVGPDA